MNFPKFLSFFVWQNFFCLLFFLALSSSIYSQNYLRGTVIDSTTSQPIPQVNVWTNHSHTISDAEGNFSLLVWKDDTLHFTHISYYDLAIKVGHDTHLPVVISLQQKTRLLDEVKIYSYLSENAFKQKVMETTPVLSQEEEIAQINSKIMSYLAQYAPPCVMNANDNYVEYMKGPQGVVIFSSKPYKGLIRAFKNVLNPSLPSYKRFYPDSINLLRPNRSR